MLLLATVIPSKFWRVAPKMTVEKPEVLEISNIPLSNPSDVSLVCIPIDLQQIADADEAAAEPQEETAESSSSSSSSSTQKSADSASGVDVPGAYPESRFLEESGEESGDESGNENGDGNESDAENSSKTTSLQTKLPDNDIFSSSFLSESPMIDSRQVASRSAVTRVGQNENLNLIPIHSGINGRSLYGPRVHVVEDGDSLERMASRYLGDSARSHEIYEKNRDKLTNEEELPIGVVLEIPERE